MNTIAKYPGSLMADIASTAGVANFGQYLRAALYQCRFAIVGGWEDSELSMSDDFVAEAFAWLMGGHVTDELKADFIFTDFLKEGDTRRGAMVFNAIKSGDWIPIMREHVEDLVKEGGHWQSLREYAFGPDRRPDEKAEWADDYERAR